MGPNPQRRFWRESRISQRSRFSLAKSMGYRYGFVVATRNCTAQSVTHTSKPALEEKQGTRGEEKQRHLNLSGVPPPREDEFWAMALLQNIEFLVSFYLVLEAETGNHPGAWV